LDRGEPLWSVARSWCAEAPCSLTAEYREGRTPSLGVREWGRL